MSKKDYSSKVEIKKLDKDQVEALKSSVAYGNKYLFIKPLKTKAKAYCSCCNKRFDMDMKTYKQVKGSHLCPMCFNEMHIRKPTTVESKTEHCVFKINEKYYGYYVWYSISINGIKLKYEQTLFGDPSKSNIYLYVRNIMASMGYQLSYQYKSWHPDRYNKWRKGKATSYLSRSIRVKETWWTERTKKEYLENHAFFVQKSNQKKIAIDNLINAEQITAMVMFNVNNPEDLYRNRKYIQDNWRSLEKQERFTTATLDYLRKNKIRLDLYKDYANACQKIGRKVDRPKDFELWHDRITELVEIKDNAKLNKGISKQYKKLSRYNKNGAYTIKAIESFEEVYKVAKQLHNCMARLYAEPYSKGKTELYYAIKDEKPVIAIEVNNNKLTQVYLDHNQQPTKTQKNYVQKWFKEVRMA